MSLFRPQTARHLAEFFNDIVKKWDQLTPEEKESVDWVNPDEPIVVSVPNPEFEGKQNEDEDDYGNSRKLYFHVISHGGGGDIDDDGNDCGHQGAELSGMVIGSGFYFNGRRLEQKK